MKARSLGAVVCGIVPLLACSSAGAPSGFGSYGTDAGGSGSSSSSGGGLVTGDGGTIGMFGSSDASAPVPPSACQYHDGTDHDGDGFSSTSGDCNDCDPNSNPGAFDVPKNGIDEDCNGTPDDEPTGCDSAAVLDSTDPFNAVLALDLCRKTSATATGKQRTWGVIDAQFVAPDETSTCGNGPCSSNANFPLGHGNLTHLGVDNPRQGSHMLAISSGSARDPMDPGYKNVRGFDKGYMVSAAAGFPTAAPACPGVVTGQPHDGMALRVVIRVPTNAKSFSFNENFFSYEFPMYICSRYNDTFVVEMAPKLATLPNGNIAFDQAGNPISVNNSLLQVCDPQNAGGKSFTCPLGSTSLQSTGFGKDTAGQDHAATGWLQTTVNVDSSLTGQDVTLLFAIWDSGDGLLDSTALIDNFVWSTQAGQSTPVTMPSPGAQ